MSRSRLPELLQAVEACRNDVLVTRRRECHAADRAGSNPPRHRTSAPEPTSWSPSLCLPGQEARHQLTHLLDRLPGSRRGPRAGVHRPRHLIEIHPDPVQLPVAPPHPSAAPLPSAPAAPALGGAGTLPPIGVPDIESLIASNVPEGEQIEFKESLSTEKGTVDPGTHGKDKIGNQAKEALLTEAVGFANAYGGAVLLGIRESKTKPPVAAKIAPIQRCADFAERLKLVFRDCVEQQLPRIDIFAVPTEGGSGVVIIRVGQSRLAPHRVKVKKIRTCPIRRADRCEEMSMREIQDMNTECVAGT